MGSINSADKNLPIKFFSLIFLFFSLSTSHPEDYVKVYVELPYGPTTLVSTFFCFNEMETGEKLASEFFNVNGLPKILKNVEFTKLQPVSPGSKISGFNYAIMCHNREFWFFKNQDDGFLWGAGFFLKMNGKNTED